MNNHSVRAVVHLVIEIPGSQGLSPDETIKTSVAYADRTAKDAVDQIKQFCATKHYRVLGADTQSKAIIFGENA